MIACYKGHIRIAKYLLSLGAGVNRKSVKGNTALHDCAESGSLDILKLLIEYGATMDVDSYGKKNMRMLYFFLIIIVITLLRITCITMHYFVVRYSKQSQVIIYVSTIIYYYHL